jgi:NADH dehydrogenase
VIVGGGFAGITAAHVLGDKPVQVTLIDRSNHHLFQPLLYQVALATLAPSDITAPIRWLLRGYRNVEVLMESVDAVEPDRNAIKLASGTEIPYDYLILATGARHSYFGHPEWETEAPGLKTLDDALTIRNRFLSAFEQAEMCDDPAERRAWQTFVIVGGGPTGVELSGLIPEIAKHALHGDFHHADTRRTRVILVEAGQRLLPAFPEDLSQHTLRDLEELGVEVRLGCTVTEIEPGVVELDGEKIQARTVFWAAGNKASPVLQSLGAPLDKAGRVQVEPDLSVPGHKNVFVVGDSAAFVDRGKPVPGVAPAANQEGGAAARNVLNDVAGRPRETFHYFNKGDLATIGRQKAIANFGFVHVTGRLAWWLWLFVHIMYLAGFRNRVSVLIQWAYAYITYQRGVRLISGKGTIEGRKATA